jgi:signal transduction histidine kinase
VRFTSRRPVSKIGNQGMSARDEIFVSWGFDESSRKAHGFSPTECVKPVVQPAISNCVTGRLMLEDSGPGIDPKRLDEIFDTFVTTKAKGMGLGLAICRRIIENHGGKLTAFSDGKSGARFQFILATASQIPRVLDNSGL